MSSFGVKDQPARPKSVSPDSTKTSRKSLVMNNKPRRSNVVKENTGSPEKKNGVRELREKLSCSEGLELEFLNRKLKEDLAAAEAKIAALSSPHPHQVQQQISNNFHSLKEERVKWRVPEPQIHTETHCQQIGPPESYKCANNSLLPPPPPLPPPPAPPRFPAKRATASKAPSLVVDLLTRKEKKMDSPAVAAAAWNPKKLTVVSVHSSIVGEIQNRSAHLLAIKADVETKGEFINSLIDRVLAAAYKDIEDVVKFVDRLDKELSSLADERAVLKHFKWPERKADAMREAAIEYRDLKLLETEISSYEDDASIPCGIALKLMAGLLDKKLNGLVTHVIVLDKAGFDEAGHDVHKKSRNRASNGTQFGQGICTRGTACAPRKSLL
ncbi:Hydroxyproline-rich glycoprotein family protein, putative isoform 4 [Hibiscus syriacus]|uniref:Hydroxyproline-rich glycoprotein family protein, putative isoform 4 n=1 Tax=Hibiscus syriacus TaxID=106335 RepID=A0A6A2Z1Y4_HIBSY|nr:Hydroxyproline-rich glycoprotein family protein, putative isoform 4 [Hibiscus syriacus]